MEWEDYDEISYDTSEETVEFHASIPSYKTKGEVLNAMARGEISRQDGIKLLPSLPSTLATKEEIAEAECSPPAEYKVCHNDKDLVTNDCWSDSYKPDIIIKFLNSDNLKQKPFVLCYDSESFRQTLENPENEFRAWYPNETRQERGEGIDKTGHGGMPSAVEVYYKIGLNNYISNNIGNVIHKTGTFVGYPLYKNKLIGNPRGEFGVGDIHGQEPGETIYFLLHEDNDLLDLAEEVKRINSLKDIDRNVPVSNGAENILNKLDKDTIPLIDITTGLDPININEAIDYLANQDVCAMLFYRFEDDIFADDVFCSVGKLKQAQLELAEDGVTQFFTSHEIKDNAFVKPNELTEAIKSMIRDDYSAIGVLENWYEEELEY